MIVQAISSTVLCVVVVGVGLRGRMEAPHDVEQQRQHEHRDQGDDHQQQVVQRLHLLHQRRVGRRKVHLPVMGHADDGRLLLLRLGASRRSQGPPAAFRRECPNTLADHAFCPLSPPALWRVPTRKIPRNSKRLVPDMGVGGNRVFDCGRYVAASRSHRAFGAATAHLRSAGALNAAVASTRRRGLAP